MELDWKAVISIYAAVLSTAVFIWNVRNAKGRVKANLVYGVEKTGDEYVSGIHVAIQNHSNKSVYVRSVSVLYPYRKKEWFERVRHLFKYRNWPSTVDWVQTSPSYEKIETGLPKIIEPGDSHGFLLPEDKLAELTESRISAKIKVCVQDALWRNTYSNPIEWQLGKDQ